MEPAASSSSKSCASSSINNSNSSNSKIYVPPSRRHGGGGGGGSLGSFPGSSSSSATGAKNVTPTGDGRGGNSWSDWNWRTSQSQPMRSESTLSQNGRTQGHYANPWDRGGSSERGSRGGRGDRGGGGRGRGRGGPPKFQGSFDRDRGCRRGRGGGGGGGHKEERTQVASNKQIEPIDLIYHAFLPKQLPENLQVNLVDIEEKMLSVFITSLTNIIREDPPVPDQDFPAPELRSCLEMMKQWKRLQPKWDSQLDETYFVKCLSDALASQDLEMQTIPIYVRKQNCCLILSKRLNSQVELIEEEKENLELTEISTFRPMLPSDLIMSTVGSLAVTFPETSDFVYNGNLLNSEQFLRHLHQLAVEDFVLTLPTTSKGSSEFTDLRDVPEPFLVTDWLVGSLAPANVKQDLHQTPKFTKKIRDQVNCEMSSRAIPFRRSGMWTSIKVTLQYHLFKQLPVELKGQKQQEEAFPAKILYKLIMLWTLSDLCQEYFQECRTPDLDLCSQFLAKLGRRVEKLEKESSDIPDKMKLLKVKCLEHCFGIVNSGKEYLYNLWKKAQESLGSPILEPIPGSRSPQDYESDLEHSIPFLEALMEKQKSQNKNQSASKIKLENQQKSAALTKSSDFNRSQKIQRFRTLQEILEAGKKSFNSTFSSLEDTSEQIWLHDTEYFIKFLLGDYLLKGQSSKGHSQLQKELHSLTTAYFKIAPGRYSAINGSGKSDNCSLTFHSDPDPIQCSQMILTVLKLIQCLDKFARQLCPWLAEYKSGVNPRLLQKLLLPHEDDLCLLHDLLTYFDHRNKNAKYSSLIHSNKISPDSFSVRFGSQDEDIQGIRQRILETSDKLEKEKLAEVTKVKQECEKLRQEFYALGGPCSISSKSEDHDPKSWRLVDKDASGKVHDNKSGTLRYDLMTCDRCRLDRLITQKSRSVKIYERPLPDCEFLQFAVIFELKIPPEIAILRDCLALLNFELLGQPLFQGLQKKINFEDEANQKKIPMQEWTQYLKRRGGGQPQAKGQVDNPDYQPHEHSGINSVSLVSPTVATSGTSNVKLQNRILDVFTSPPEKFVVDNNLGCVLYHEKPLWFPVISSAKAQTLTTFQIKTTSISQAKIYGNLQWSLTSYPWNNPNSSLAQKMSSRCHQKLTPEEFALFGSIRTAGHRVQLRNLLWAIQDRGLAFHLEPVLALVLQTIWEVGLGWRSKSTSRSGGSDVDVDKNDDDFHWDFRYNAPFCLEFLDILENLLESRRENYSEPLIMYLVVAVTAKILEVGENEECSRKCCELLRKCRQVGNYWNNKIEVQIANASADSSENIDKDEQLSFHKLKQLQVTLAMALTYNVSEGQLHLNKNKSVLETCEDYVTWFQIVTRLHQLTDQEQCHQMLSSFEMILLRYAKSVALRLDLELHRDQDEDEDKKKRKNLLLESLKNFVHEKLGKAVKILWTPVNSGEDGDKHFLIGGYEEEMEQSTSSDVKGQGQIKNIKAHNYLSFDMLLGVFLVNGFPESMLPLSVLEHPLFRRYFKHTKFRIQRFAMSAKTQEKFHGKHYEFEVIIKERPANSGSGVRGRRTRQLTAAPTFEMVDVIIREIQDDSSFLQLLEPTLFQKVLQPHFIEHFSHWWDPKTGTVYLRRLPQKESDYRRPHEYTLEISPGTGKSWRLFDEHRHKFLLHWNSPGFQSVTAPLTRLEYPENIQVFLNDLSKDGNPITVKLPRYQLTFDLCKETGFLESIEYANFRVASNQNLGTLIGLQNGLLLEHDHSTGNPDKYSKRILLVPHGLTQTILRQKWHPSTDINIDQNKLRSPPYFAFEYDTTLRTLKASRNVSAWLYLAALHGVTSSSLPDPFTGMTGTEMCLEILQSARVWPSEPYDRESLTTLEMVRCLAPRRAYYGQGLSFLESSNENKKKKENLEKMEITQWPTPLTVMASYDGYPFIVDRLIEVSEGLRVLFPEEKENVKRFQYKPRYHRHFHHYIKDEAGGSVVESQKLQIRAYLRCLGFYNGFQAHLKPEFLKKDVLEVIGKSGSSSFAGFELSAKHCLRKKSKVTTESGFCVQPLLLMGQHRLEMKMSTLSTSTKKCNLTSHFFNNDGIEVLLALPSENSEILTHYLQGAHLKELFNLDFTRDWIQLYHWAAFSAGNDNRDAFTQALNALAYRGTVSLNQVMHLHHISILASQGIEFPPVPDFSLDDNEFADDLNLRPELQQLHKQLLLRDNQDEEKDPKGKVNDLEETEIEVIIPADWEFDLDVIQDILESHMIIGVGVTEKNSGEVEDEGCDMAERMQKVKGDARRITMALLDNFWPCARLPSSRSREMRDLFRDTEIDLEASLKDINRQIMSWNRNLKFNEFLEKVEDTLNKALKSQNQEENVEGQAQLELIYSRFPETALGLQIVPDGVSPMQSLRILLSHDHDQGQGQHFLLNDRERDILEEAKVIWKTGRLPELEAENVDFQERRKTVEQKISELTQVISGKLCGQHQDPSPDHRSLFTISRAILARCGSQLPRLTSTSLLQHLLPEYYHQADPDDPLVTFLGAISVLWSVLKRFNRIISMKQRLLGPDIESVKSDLSQELSNKGYIGWSPKDHPEWLLLELELDVTIRHVQVDVARIMMSMPENDGNGVTQLNMGQGKTFLIVPMLCAALADPKETLVRVTVMTSIFKTNLTLLKFALGGSHLNRRVYTFPLRRDLPVTPSDLDKIMDSLKDCIIRKGVVLTVPEHTLSIWLLALNNILKGEYELGGKFLDLWNWLQYYARDVLDESDELLSVMNQKVYTIGRRVADGADDDHLRWTTCQQVLEIVQNVAGELLEKFGLDSGKIEFDLERKSEHSEEFVHFRLLDQDLQDFKEKVANGFLMDFINLSEKNEFTMIRDFMTLETVSEQGHLEVMEFLQNKVSKSNLQKILLMSGYLRRGVLTLALSKRWWVDYGVDPDPDNIQRGQRSRLMCVPFKNMGVPAEKNEFGHPDLPIVLTHLSYYYSGLSEDQLQEVFGILGKMKKVEAEAIYDRWIEQILPGERVPPSLRRFECLNIHDVDQWRKFFQMLRQHKQVIDLWLGHLVFPREIHHYSAKISMTPNDLCDGNRHPVTGFSGTNDSGDLLPLQMIQQDLEELQNTNAEVERALRRPENDRGHKWFPMGATSKEILEELGNDRRHDPVKILIDAGALMVDCRDNEEVAKLWLEATTEADVEAVVYFNKKGEMLVKVRGQAVELEDIPLELSPYRGHLGKKTAVFLDDQHSRGTDLKFPVGARAVVTIGARMKRSKLVQASMRMRKLMDAEDHCHYVTFYLSHEAYHKIRSRSPGKITTDKILTWVTENTGRFTEDGFLYWVLMTLNHAKRMAAEDNFKRSSALGSSKSIRDLDILGTQCIDQEVTSILEMYGHHSERQLLVEVIPKWFEMTMKKFGQLPTDILERFQETMERVMERVGNCAGGKTLLSSCGSSSGPWNMEERQEREIEQEQEKETEKETEVEEEREVEGPGPATPWEPELHENVIKVALGELTLETDLEIEGIQQGLQAVFQETSFWNMLQENWKGSGEIFVTSDFCRVIQIDKIHSNTDDFLRPVQYILSLTPTPTTSSTNKNRKFLILSPFEVNELLPILRGTGSSLSPMTVTLHMFSRRRFQNQDCLLNKERLQLPLPLPLSSTPGESRIPDESKSLASLFFASGNLYFGSAKESETFQKIFERSQNFPGVIEVMSKILKCRHAVVSEMSDLLTMINKLV